MSKRKHPARRRGANVIRRDAKSGFHSSDSLIKREDLRLPADDFKPGSHLEVGELEQRRMSRRVARRHAYQMTSHSEPQQRRASVDHDTVGVLYLEHIEVDGMSEYPHRHIQSQNGS